MFEFVVGQRQSGVGSATPGSYRRRRPVFVEGRRAEQAAFGGFVERACRRGFGGRRTVILAVEVVHHWLVITLADVVVAIVHPSPGTAQQCPSF